MIHYIYDGTFEGLLTVIAGAVESNEEVKDITLTKNIQPELFTEILEVKTDPVLAERFFEVLSKQFSKTILTDLCYCYLSEKTGIEKLMLDYIRLLFANGERVSGKFADSTILQVRRISDRVSHEILRFHGFIRFRKLKNGVYFAMIEPDYNIIQFLAPHFTARFADQQWLIHDLKRSTGIYYDGRQCTFISSMEISPEAASVNTPFVSGREASILDQEELVYENIWNQYFQQIAITERQNKKLQKQRMPVRYWRYLVEQVEDTNSKKLPFKSF